MSKLTITLAQLSDAVAVEALLDAAAHWQQSRGIQQWTPGQFGEDVQLTIAAGDVYVARRDGAMVGCFMLEDHNPKGIKHWLTERRGASIHAAYLGRLAVTREASGQGLGVELLNAASTIAAKRGLSYLRLDCPADNARLRRYYVDVGFSHMGDASTRGPNGERWVCSVFERPTSTSIVRPGSTVT